MDLDVFSLRSLGAFEAFFQAHHARICYHARQTVVDQAVAEDIAQEAFISLWEIRDRFSNETTAKAWLYRVVQNKSLNHLRHLRVVSKKSPDLAGEEAVSPDYLDALVKTEALAHIHRAIENLPDGCRRIFKMSYFEGMKNLEIAADLNVSVNTVKTQKARALQLIRLKVDPDLLGLFLLCLKLRSGYPD